jgi:signal transduction histidine kinase
MSVALENARLFNETTHLLEETKQRAAELSTVNSISKALASHLELDKLIHLVGEKMRELFKANMAYVALYDKNSKMIYFPYGYGDEFPPLSLGEGLTSKIIISGEPLLINKEIDTMTAQLGIQRVGIPATSYLGVPIPVGDEIIGVISVQSTEQENRFSESDMRLLNTIAANVGVAINNAEAYRQLNKTVEQLNVTLKDLKSTQQQLIIQEKLASLGQLTAGIAHEIKNPLNFVNNFAEVSIELVNDLKQELIKQKENISAKSLIEIEDILKDLEENAHRINQHGKRADSIVRSMLQHSRGKAGERQDSDINAILEEDLNLAYHGMRARDTSFNITIEKDFDKNLKKISIVPQDISRVFLNIINNGFYEANKKKKNRNGNFSPILKVETEDLDNKIEVRIRDNGNGIPPEVRDKLFNPFFTTKPSGEGTGLGLSLSHDIIVKQHQGEIKFKTEMGEYTEFTISLPKNSLNSNN